MVGQVLGAVGSLPEIFTELEISYFLLRRLLGVRTEGDKKGAKVSVWKFIIIHIIIFVRWCVVNKHSSPCIHCSNESQMNQNV